MPFQLDGQRTARVPNGPNPGMQSNTNSNSCIDDSDEDVPNLEFLIPAFFITVQ